MTVSRSVQRRGNYSPSHIKTCTWFLKEIKTFSPSIVGFYRALFTKTGNKSNSSSCGSDYNYSNLTSTMGNTSAGPGPTDVL